MYEDPAGKINSSTKFDASFNFRLADTIEDHLSSKMAGVYEDRIKGLEEKINELSQPEEEEMTPQGQMWAMVGKILEHPQVQQAIAGKILGFIDGLGSTLSGVFKQPAQRAAIGATSTAQDENQKLQQAVNILVTVDPQLGTHLLKLAEVAQADPSKYEQLIGMLKLL